MNIENEIFKKSKVIFNKLITYGFIKEKDNYVYETLFFNDSFKAIIKVNKDGKVIGSVIDIESNEEYLGFRIEGLSGFASKVKEEYINILNDIKNNCFEGKYFIFDQSNRITKYIKDKYNNDPEFLWDKYDGSGVFRNSNSGKWYGIIMNIDISKLDKGSGEIEVLNVKIDENKIPELIKQKGYYEAYHMNKKYWISIILNDTLSDKNIISLIDESYKLVS
jgi:predicted DNA-binding protein (MmcQ/YjbR family)